MTSTAFSLTQFFVNGQIIRAYIAAVALAAICVQARGAEPLRIGQTAILSGPLQGLGREVTAGLQAHLREVNGTGGIGGRQLELIQLDDGFSEDQAERNVVRLAEEGIVALVMPIGTPPTLGAGRGATAKGIPYIGAFTGAEPTRKHTPMTFLLRASFKDELERIVQHALTVGLSDVVVVHNANPGAASGVGFVRGALERSGKTLRGAVPVNDDLSNVAGAVDALEKLRPQTVIFSSNTAVAAEVIKRFRPIAASTRFFAYSFVDGRAVFARIGKAATGLVVSQVVPDPWNAANPLAQQYRAAMTTSGNSEFGYQSFEGYIAARVLTEALRRAGPSPTSERVKTALSKSGPFVFGDFRVEFSEQRHIGRSSVELTMVSSEGKYVK